MIMMLAPKDKIAGSIIETLTAGKKMHNGPKEFDEMSKMAALELVKAIESKNPNAIISAFLALSMEVEKYEPEED